MRVTIGPYINRWTSTSFENWCHAKLHGKEYSWEVDEADYIWLDRVVDFVGDHWQTVLNYTINLYLDRKQRKINIHIDGYDVWSMDHTLSMIILPMLKKLDENKHGSPMVDDEDVPEGLGLRSTEAPPCEDWETDDNVHKRWEWVMSELIWTFEQLADDDNDSQFHSGEHDIDWAPVDKDGNDVPADVEGGIKWYEMRKGANDTHVFDREGYQKHQERIKNGLRLFGKYYQGLWD